MAKKLSMSKRLLFVSNELRAEVASQNAHKGHVGRGLMWEGYEGGYRQALSDVLLSLNDITDCNSRHENLWKKALGHE